MASRNLAPEDALDLLFAMDDSEGSAGEPESSDEGMSSSEEMDLDRQLLSEANCGSGTSESESDGPHIDPGATDIDDSWRESEERLSSDEGDRPPPFLGRGRGAGRRAARRGRGVAGRGAD